MNAGNKKFEEKLKVITLAYTQLKNTYRGKIDTNIDIAPDIKLSVKQTFGIESDMEIEGFSKNEFVPEIDSYKFDRDTTLAVLSGFPLIKEF